MELKTSKELGSSGYRCLFEYVKKEGVEPALAFFDDIDNFYCNRNTLLKNSIVFGENDLIRINRRNRDIVKYIREHKKDMKNINLADENILNELYRLQKDNTLVDLYLENAKRLEDLKVSDIKFNQFPQSYYYYYCGIYRNNDGQIIRIVKNYIDGKIKVVNEERLIEKMHGLYDFSKIPYTVDNIVDNEIMTFCLRTENTEHGHSIRTIEIKDFGFNGDKLPTEEEISSYDIPLQLIKK